MTGRDDRPAHPSRVRRIVGTIVAVLLVSAVTVGSFFRRQTVSYLTHWKGAPANTRPWKPHDPPPPVHLAAIGDIGDSGLQLDEVSGSMEQVAREAPFDALILLGDNVYPSGDVSRLDATVFKPFGQVLREAKLLAILGNHDVLHSDGTQMMDVLGQDGRYWSERIGDVLVVGLDSNALDDTQLGWLDRTLGDTDATWRIICLHHPPYSAGYQGSRVELRRTLVPILERHGVQLVLSGHDHDYQRSKPMNGVTYIVSGGGSGTRRTGEATFTAKSFSWPHFLDLDVYPDRMVVRAVGIDGSVGDEAVIRP